MVLHYASRLFLSMNLRSGSKKSKCMSFQFMMDNNMIHQVGKGLFALLPLGQRVLTKLEHLVEEELLAVGAQKLELPLLGDKDLWTKTERWTEMGSELFRLTDRLGQEFCLQPTAEEMITNTVHNHGLQRRSCFPIMLFQCSQKFRDEPSPKYGLLRSRQFLMNDMYSFDPDEASSRETYDRILSVYDRIFREKLGLTHVYRIQADSGSIGGEISHEYHLANNSCEDKIYVCDKCQIAVGAMDSEEFPSKCQNCSDELSPINSVEIAHTFQLGTKYSSAMKSVSSSTDPYFMCCFGIGITRLIPACIDELSSSERAMRLPYKIVPYKVAFVLPKNGPSDAKWVFAETIFEQLDKMPNLRNEILVDDRCDKSIGRRLSELNQLGVPHIFVANSLKSDNPFDVPTLEYFRSCVKEDSLQQKGRVSHRDLFGLVSAM